MPRTTVQTLLDMPGIARDSAGNALATADVLSSLWLPRLDSPTQGSVILRGISLEALAVRPEITLLRGRLFQPGLRELIVGQSALGRYAGLAPGDRIIDSGNEWTVVGVFSSGGSAHESELWTDAESVLSAFNRNTFNSVTAWTTDTSGFERLQAAVTADSTLSVDVYLESAYYQQQSGQFSGFLTVVGKLIAGIMAVGAVFGALNSMYAVVSSRTREIATLRALGFGTVSVVTAVIVESLLLCVAGAVVGATLAWLVFNGNTVSAASGNGIAQVMFALNVGMEEVATGVWWSLVLGLVGGSFPAITAARLPVAVALRGA
jgi:putative ABC transport system permease protein